MASIYKIESHLVAKKEKCKAMCLADIGTDTYMGSRYVTYLCQNMSHIYAEIWHIKIILLCM